MATQATAEKSNIHFTPAPLEWFRAPTLARQPVETPGSPATAAIPLSFVRRLATDADLRSELEASPAETLARHGIYAAPESIPAMVSLPGQQELERVINCSATDEDRAFEERFAGFVGC